MLSSRRLEAECHRNIEVMWLLRRLKPDFKTIANFRRENAAAFRQVFRAIVVLCRDPDLFGRELLAIDGTRIKAVNNKDRNVTRASLETFIRSADAKLADYFRRLNEGDADEARVRSAPGGSRTDNLAGKIEALRQKRGRYAAILDDLKASGEDQISLTGTVTPARAVLEVATIDAVVDKGYFKIEDIVACEAAGIIPHVPKPQRGPAVREGFFRKDEFRYDAERDAYLCPANQVLATRYESRLCDLKKVDYFNRAACLACSIRSRCTNGFRKVSRLEGEEVLDRMAARLAARPELLDRRRESVEHLFVSIAAQFPASGAA